MTPQAHQLSHHRHGLGIAYRLAAMACVACLSAGVRWTGHRGIPVFEIVFFRNAFAFIPLGLYIWRTTGWTVLKTQRPLGHLHRSAVGLLGMVCSFFALQRLAEVRHFFLVEREIGVAGQAELRERQHLAEQQHRALLRRQKLQPGDQRQPCCRVVGAAGDCGAAGGLAATKIAVAPA